MTEQDKTFNSACAVLVVTVVVVVVVVVVACNPVLTNFTDYTIQLCGINLNIDMIVVKLISILCSICIIIVEEYV